MNTCVGPNVKVHPSGQFGDRTEPLAWQNPQLRIMLSLEPPTALGSFGAKQAGGEAIADGITDDRDALVELFG